MLVVLKHHPICVSTWYVSEWIDRLKYLTHLVLFDLKYLNHIGLNHPILILIMLLQKIEHTLFVIEYIRCIEDHRIRLKVFVIWYLPSCWQSKDDSVRINEILLHAHPEHPVGDVPIAWELIHQILLR